MLSDNQHLVISSRDTVKNGVMYSVLVSYKQEGLRFLVFVDNHVFNRLFRNYNMLLRIIILALAAVFILLFIILLEPDLQAALAFYRKRWLSCNREIIRSFWRDDREG